MPPPRTPTNILKFLKREGMHALHFFDDDETIIMILMTTAKRRVRRVEI